MSDQMTAPAIVESAPVSSASPESIDSIVSESVAAALAESPEQTEAIKRDEATGRFLPKEPPDTAEDQSAQIVADASAPPVEVEAEPEPVALPEGVVLVPKVEGRELATQFTIKDKDGELEIPDIVIEFNANGKTRSEPLDKVVRLAQFGLYNEEREQQVKAAQVATQETQRQNQMYQQELQRLTLEREQLLSNDDYYLSLRAEYEQANTPAARMEKMQQQMQETQHRQEFAQVAQLGQQFFASELTPAVDTITKALPTVSEEEIGAKLLLVSDRFKVHTPFGSIIPPSAYPAIKQAIVTDIVPWAQHVHESRQSERQQQRKQSEADVSAAKAATLKAQADAQKKTSLLTKVAKPAAGRATKDTPPPKPIRTLEDAESSALSETLAAMV